MRILHVVDTLAVGGAEVLVAQLCAMQRAAGHTPSVACVLSGGALKAEIEKLGVEVRVHGPKPAWRLLWPLLLDCVRFKPDAVHCHSAYATILAAPMARLARVPVMIATRHGLVPPGDEIRRETKFWRAARRCDHVVAVCDVARNNMLQGPGAIPSKLCTVRNGASPAAGTLPAVKQHDRFTIIHVARLNPVKDAATLLRAFALLHRRVPDALLWIVGDGALRAELEQLARELAIDSATVFFGERRDVGALLSAADLFVLCSIAEGVPISLLEAMAAGLPQIVTDAGGMPEVVNLCGTGTVVPVRNADALAAAMESFARDRAQLPTLAEKARRCYEEHFSAEQMSRAYERLYAPRQA